MGKLIQKIKMFNNKIFKNFIKYLIFILSICVLIYLVFISIDSSLKLRQEENKLISNQIYLSEQELEKLAQKEKNDIAAISRYEIEESRRKANEQLSLEHQKIALEHQKRQEIIQENRRKEQERTRKENLKGFTCKVDASSSSKLIRSTAHSLIKAAINKELSFIIDKNDESVSYVSYDFENYPSIKSRKLVTRKSSYSFENLENIIASSGKGWDLVLNRQDFSFDLSKTIRYPNSGRVTHLMRGLCEEVSEEEIITMVKANQEEIKSSNQF